MATRDDIRHLNDTATGLQIVGARGGVGAGGNGKE
jgi:hypothetical protein